MGIVVSFANLTIGKDCRLFLLSNVKRPAHRSPLQSVCFAAAEEGSKACAHLQANAEPVDGAGGFRCLNEKGITIVEMRRDSVTKDWSWFARDATKDKDRINLCINLVM